MLEGFVFDFVEAFEAVVIFVEFGAEVLKMAAMESKTRSTKLIVPMGLSESLA